MVIKYTNIYHSKAIKKFTQISDFWFENKPSGNPGVGTPQNVFFPKQRISKFEQKNFKKSFSKTKKNKMGLRLSHACNGPTQFVKCSHFSTLHTYVVRT
jgi:hypothetical protein